MPARLRCNSQKWYTLKKMKKTQSQYQKMNYVFFKLTWFYIFSICLHTFLAFLPEVQRFYSFMITLDISWHCRIFLLPNITLIYNSEYNLLRRLISVCRNCKPANNTPAFSLKENLKRHSLDYRIGLCLENMEHMGFEHLTISIKVVYIPYAHSGIWRQNAFQSSPFQIMSSFRRRDSPIIFHLNTPIFCSKDTFGRLPDSGYTALESWSKSSVAEYLIPLIL